MFKKLATIQVTLLMFSITFLLNLNFTILRSVRNTLTIADLGGSASSIPYFELFGVFPAWFNFYQKWVTLDVRKLAHF